MPRIRIVKTPNGLGVPDWVRKEWVGLEFEAGKPKFGLFISIIGPFSGIRLGRGYPVLAQDALLKLKTKSESAWKWFQDNRMTVKALKEAEEKDRPRSVRIWKDAIAREKFFFLVKFCEVVS
jgi:hypothetical protein